MSPGGQHHLAIIRFLDAKDQPSPAGMGSRIESGPPVGPRTRRAFTLIELMVVIALIGILSAMIVPEMRGTYEEALLRSTSRHLVNLCSLASSRAISLQQIRRVRLDPTRGRYVIEKPAPRARTGDEFVPDREVADSEGELDTRIAIRFQRPAANPEEPEGPQEKTSAGPEANELAGEVILTFHPDGTADAGEIQLRDRQGFGLLLRLSPATARVRVRELPRE